MTSSLHFTGSKNRFSFITHEASLQDLLLSNSFPGVCVSFEIQSRPRPLRPRPSPHALFRASAAWLRPNAPPPTARVRNLDPLSPPLPLRALPSAAWARPLVFRSGELIPPTSLTVKEVLPASGFRLPLYIDFLFCGDQPASVSHRTGWPLR